MEFLSTLLIALAVTVIIRLVEEGFQHRHGLRVILWSLLHFRGRVRVSVASLCAIKDGGDFLLVRQERRPDQVGPLGGAVHVFEAGLAELQELDFVVEGTEEPHWEAGNAYALRGTLPALKLHGFQKWLSKPAYGKEGFEESVVRELYEELQLPDRVMENALSFGTFRVIRNVEEGPKYVKGKEIWQWRYMRVFEYTPRGEAGAKLMSDIRAAEGAGKQLQFVRESDIRSGRTGDKTLIGNHSEYLFGVRARRSEVPWSG